MSEPRNDGGPAFPLSLPNVPVPLDEVSDVLRRSAGMTLRDYFAAHALARYSPEYVGKMQDAYGQIAQNCYAIADAMLAERDTQR